MEGGGGGERNCRVPYVGARLPQKENNPTRRRRKGRTQRAAAAPAQARRKGGRRCLRAAFASGRKEGVVEMGDGEGPGDKPRRIRRDMETFRHHQQHHHRHPPGLVLEERTRIGGHDLTGLKETEVVKNMKIFDWSPEEEDVAGEMRDASEYEFEDLDLDNEAWESNVTDTRTEAAAVSQYEKENWDKELAESENDSPYDFEDVIHSGGFFDQDPATSCSTQERPLYDPSFHHAASLTLNLTQEVTPVNGQFDDAVD